MTRLTGLVKPESKRCYQCGFCKRYFRNIPLHQATGTACKKIQEVTK